MYDNLKDVKLNNLLRYRDKISVYYANKIRLRAKKEPNFAQYIDRAKDMMYV
jgi:hypothetical protein